MINKMPGYEIDKFANLRTAYGFMFGHPGKKLLFMGQEFAQLREWSEARSLDWYLLDQPLHKGMQEFVKDLNHLYTKYDSLYFNDNDPMGFEWTKCDDPGSGIVGFVRRGSSVKDQLLFICNFVPVERKQYRIGAPCQTVYTEILNSDEEKYGGQGRTNKGKRIKGEAVPCDKMENSITLDIAPLTVIVLKYNYVDPVVEAAVPKLESKPAETAAVKTESKPKAESKPKTASKSKAESKPKTASKPKAESKPKTASKSKAESKPKTASKPKAESKPKTASKPKAESKPKTESKSKKAQEQSPKKAKSTKK
jgi:hypothetical protein